MEFMEPREVTIDRARGEDAEGINEVHYQAWLKTYPNAARGITVEDIEARFAERSEERLARRRQSLESPEQGTTTLVAREGEQVVGVCRVIAKSHRNQLQMIYVHPEYQRRGIGYGLWEESRNHMDASADIYVEVVDFNEQAINFYRKLGFVPTGRTIRDERFRMKSGAIFTEIEMVLKAR
jgi:ribosomal protein S18 acetylase RimI-like enzyme